MDYRMGTKLYRIVNYCIEEYVILRKQGSGFAIMNIITGRELYLARTTIEDVKGEFNSYSISKICTMNMLQERLELMLRDITNQIIDYKSDFNETQKYKNIKFTVEPIETT